MKCPRLKSCTLLCCLMMSLVASSSILAQEFTLERGGLVAGGTVNSSGGPMELKGTLSEWAASSRGGVSDGQYSLTGGFWAKGSARGDWPGLSGAWFDPNSNGEGFNLQVFPGGFFGYFYGYDQGERLWLMLDVYAGSFQWNEPIEVPVMAGVQGVFGDPVAPAAGGLETWGTAEITFHSCESASATLTGDSGTETFDLMLLAGVEGFEQDCTQSAASSDYADLSGAWYDPATDGQGWNFIASPYGLFGYFYGYTSSGEPLWLMVENLVSDVSAGQTITFELLSGFGGDFGNPVSPADLQVWGEADVTFHNCREATVELSGEDGSQTQNIEMLAATEGAESCNI